MAFSISKLHSKCTTASRLSRRSRTPCTAPRATYQEYQSKQQQEQQQRDVRASSVHQGVASPQPVQSSPVGALAGWVAHLQEMLSPAPEWEPWMDEFGQYVIPEEEHKSHKPMYYSHIADRVAVEPRQK